EAGVGPTVLASGTVLAREHLAGAEQAETVAQDAPPSLAWTRYRENRETRFFSAGEDARAEKAIGHLGMIPPTKRDQLIGRGAIGAGDGAGPAGHSLRPACREKPQWPASARRLRTRRRSALPPAPRAATARPRRRRAHRQARPRPDRRPFRRPSRAPRRATRT